MQPQLRRTRSLVTILFAFTALMAVSATAALAQYVPPEPLTVTGPDQVVAGEDATFQVSGAQAGEQITVTTTIDGDVVYNEVHTADEAGHLTFTVSIPADAAGSDGTVTVEGDDETDTHEFSVVAADDDVAPVEEDVEPVTAAEDERLPVTGGQVLLLALVGMTMVGGGALALRKRSSAAA